MIEDGENVYNSDSVYTTYDGGYAAKMWGNGGNENNLFQSYYREIEAGTQFWADVVFYQATDDHVGEDASVVLFAKYFDDNGVGMVWIRQNLLLHQIQWMNGSIEECGVQFQMGLQWFK